MKDAFLIECRTCGNRHWIAFHELRWSQPETLRRLRCRRCGAHGGDSFAVHRLTLPYEFPLEATLYHGYPGYGPHEVLARFTANSYAYALFNWISAEYPTKRYVITSAKSVLKDTGERGP